ncbi:MAG: c-type cytochrome [Candidatus Methylomirabilales bacterium]
MAHPFHEILPRMIWGASLGVLLVLSGCGSGGSVEEGARTYARGCYSCHGPAGLGDGPTAKLMGIKPANLQRAVREKSKTEILETIARGRKAMPAFRHTLTLAEREAVYRYLLTLPGKQTTVARGLDPTGAQGLR